MKLKIARNIAALRQVRAQLQLASPGRGLHFVPTMGALHAGHAALVQRAAQAGPTIASVFVNPTQFDSAADLQAYPSSFDQDCAILEAAGAKAVFAPTASEMYGHDRSQQQEKEKGQRIEEQEQEQEQYRKRGASSFADSLKVQWPGVEKVLREAEHRPGLPLYFVFNFFIINSNFHSF